MEESQEFDDIQHVGEAGQDSDSDDVLDDDSDEFELPEPTTFASLRNTVVAAKFAKYLKDFDETAVQQSVTFASLPAHVIDEGNRAQLLAQGLEREDEMLQHQNDLDHIELLKNRRMFELQKRRIEQINELRRQLRDIQIKGTLTEELLGTYFGFSKRNLDMHLTTRTAEVLQSIGEVRRFDRGDYDPNKPDWTTFEQQVEMRIVKLRGLKDKVPKGDYLILVSKWDKLGGQPMSWNNRANPYTQTFAPCPLHSEEKNLAIRAECEICNGWCGGTMAIPHSGDQRGFEVDVNAKVFTFFPSQQSIKPYMALMFELVLLPPSKKGQPKIVGWGVMPCVDSSFSIINGKFRFPMLRGEYTMHFAHHETVRETISQDIENWLCNVYIEVFPHPREYFGRSEFQLHAEFMGHLLNLHDYPSAKEPDGWPVDHRKRGFSFDLANAEQLKATQQIRETNDPDAPHLRHAQQRLGGGGGGGVIDDANYFPYLRPAVVQQHETAVQTWWGIVRDAVLDRKRSKKAEQQRAQREAVKRAEEQKQYRFSIHPHGAVLMESAWSTQVEYCTRAILDELSLREPSSYTFWLNVLVMFASLIFQNFMRGCFVILGALTLGIPIDEIQIRPFGLVTIYSIRNTTALQEVMICFYNMLATCFLLESLIGTALFLRYASGKVPDQLSKFVFAMAWAYYFVPWVDLLIDAGEGLQHGDIMRLGNYFTYHGYGSFYGYITFGVIYFFFCAVTFVTTFLYTMRLHLNGILQDAYWRILVVNEDNFFIPADLEISQREFYHILARAERWRGRGGKRRKVAVYDLVTTDPSYPKFLQKNQYIAVYELDCDDPSQYFELKPMKIFRHFFFTFEGAILECLQDEVPTGVVAAVLRMQSTFLRAMKNGSASGDPMAMALGKNLKNVNMDTLGSGTFQAAESDDFAGSPTIASPRRRKPQVSFQ